MRAPGLPRPAQGIVRPLLFLLITHPLKGRRTLTPFFGYSYDRALHECLKKGAGHEPHMLRNAFKMHLNFEKNGTMKIE